MKIIRFIVGKIILGLDKLFTPNSMQRSAESQAKVDQELASLVIYQYEACPFCVKVRRAMKKLNLNIELRDAAKIPRYRDELVQGGGKNQVPCLRIPDGTDKYRWMYESSDIVAYLEANFATRT